MTALLFVLLALACYRAQRIVTQDDWPPSQWFRDKVEQRFGEDSSWFTLVQCSWCAGAWFSLAGTYLTHRFVHPLTFHWLLWAFAVSCVVGLIGEWESRG